MGLAWASLSSCLEDVPVAIREWKPEQAPQATVMKRVGKRVFPSCEGGELEGGRPGKGGKQNACQGYDHHGVKKEAGQIVSGLQHDPYGDQGSHRDIKADQNDPCGPCHGKAHVHAQGYDDNDADDAAGGGRTGLNAEAVGHDAVDDGQNDKEHGDHSCGLVACGICHDAEGHGSVGRGKEGARHHVDEGCDDQDQDQKGKDGKEPLGPLAHGVMNELAYRLSAVTDGCEQGAEVLQAAEENTADHAPEEDRDPAENGSLDGAVDGAGARDG